MARPDNAIVTNMDGYGVLDLGATETVGSLESIERVVVKRHEMTGQWDTIKVLPDGKKPFRFGNGSVQESESFILLPQQVGSRRILLGIYTLMAERVPILIGVKTLTKLGAIIDVQGGWLILT